MRKKILLISAALWTVFTLQAASITAELDLSTFTAWESASYDANTHVLTPTQAWGGGQVWLGTYDASAYTQAVFVLANPCTEKVAFTVTYADETAKQEVVINAGTTTAKIELNGTSIESVWAQLYSENYTAVSIALSQIYFVGTAGKQSVETLSSTETAIEDWNTGVAVLGELLTYAHAGDQVIINFETQTAGWNQIGVTSNNTYLESLPAVADVAAGATQLRFTLTANDLAQVKANGMWIGGYYVTIKSVQLCKHAILLAQEATIGNWSGGQQINAEALPVLEEGNLLCFHVTAAQADGQIYIQHNWADFPYTTPRNHVFTAEDVAALPLTVSIPLTHAFLHQLGNENLCINGQYFTMDEIYVAQGTPSDTKAAYLNVSEAGMATYLLPFNVPALPDGVAAYELTNDGSEVIMATEVNALEADKPVLIIAQEGEYEFISETGASEDVSGKTGTYANGALVGTYQAIAAVPQTEGGNYNYVLQKQGGNVAFYQVKSDDCALSPYRAYLSCAHNHSAAAPGSAPMRIVFNQEAATGIETMTNDQVPMTKKVMKEGRLLILRNGVEYNVNGQMAK